jgi:hypothetical protein
MRMKRFAQSCACLLMLLFAAGCTTYYRSPINQAAGLTTLPALIGLTAAQCGFTMRRAAPASPYNHPRSSRSLEKLLTLASESKTNGCQFTGRSTIS